MHPHGQHHRQRGGQRKDEPVALGAKLFICGGIISFAQFKRCIACGMDNGKNFCGRDALRVKADEPALSSKVDHGGGDGGVFKQLSFEGVDAGGAVQAGDTKTQFSRQFGKSCTVSQAFDLFSDVQAGNSIVVGDGRFFHGEIDCCGGDAGAC